MTIQTGDNKFSIARWIVDPTAGLGTHTTIAAALTAASSGQTIFIRPGTYTENLTLKAGVNLSAFDCDAVNPNVSIVGKATYTTAGSVSISGIRLTTNADFVLVVSGSAASIVNLSECYLNFSNNTGISHTSSSSSSVINLRNCYGDIGTAATTILVSTSAGTVNFYYCDFKNTANSTAALTTSTAQISLYYCVIQTPLSATGSGTFNIYFSQILCQNLNTTALTMAGTGTSACQICGLLGGSASAVSIGVGTVVSLLNCEVSSENANVITGAGTLLANALLFVNSVSVINPTTITARYTDLLSYKSKLQPSFLAYLAATVLNKTGNATSYTLGTDALTEVFDRASNFNTNGTFTAPETGIYDLRAQVTVTGATIATTFVISIVTTARTYTDTFTKAAGAQDETVAISCLADMTATNTATVTITVSGEAGDTDDIKGGAALETFFCGMLVA